MFILFKARLLLGISVILALGAFCTTPPVYAATVRLNIVQNSGIPVQPGQQVDISYPLKSDPTAIAMLHIKAFVPSRAHQNTSVTSNISLQAGCWDNVGMEVWATNVFGGTLMDHTLIVNYCYDGSVVTSVTTVTDDWHAYLGWN